MNISSIGVQPILPRTGTGWADANPAPAQPADAENDIAPPKPDRPAPAPTVGRILDKTV